MITVQIQKTSIESSMSYPIASDRMWLVSLAIIDMLYSLVIEEDSWHLSLTLDKTDNRQTRDFPVQVKTTTMYQYQFG